MPRSPPIDIFKIQGLLVLTKDKKYDSPSRLFKIGFRCELTSKELTTH